jgi:putative toxin-antitoxin system antitoxin component (TIGR02293 family)
MTTAIASIETLEELDALPRTELIEAIKEGLPTPLVRELSARMKVSMEEIAELLRLTPRTLQRRLEEPVLGLAESERLWELAHLFIRAVEVLESEAAAAQWFKSPIQALGWNKPITLAQTAVGLRELENILGRIEHGVFS